MSPPTTHEPIAAASAPGPGTAAAADITSIPASPIPLSASASPSPSPSPISDVEPEPELKPLIAEVLRTRYCTPGSVVLVEGVDIAQTPRASSRPGRRSRRESQSQSQQSQTQSQRRQWRAVRLLLGDGELCVQALLAPEMHPYVDAGEVAFGSYIRLERFRIEWLDDAADAESQRKGKGKGRDIDIPESERAVYLIVEDLVVVGWSQALVEMAQAGGNLSAGSDEDEDLDVALDEDEEAMSPSLSPLPSPSPSLSPSRAREERRTASKPQQEALEESSTRLLESEHLFEELENDAVEDLDFEMMPIARQEKAEENRATAVNTNIQTASIAPRPARPAIATTSTLTTRTTHPHPHARPRHTITDPTKPLKLTPLKAIPHLPYKQNWSVNVLVIVTFLSDLEPSGIPPYTDTQRRARLADTSTPKRVLLTAFLDAHEFAPAVGSVVLLLGVKNHRFDGGSLKKYASDRPLLVTDGGEGEEGRWWFGNPGEELGWCDDDARALREWWLGEQQQHQENMEM